MRINAVLMRLHQLREEADEIAVMGENVSNRRGGFTRFASAVMHDMSSYIRELPTEMDT